MNLLLDTHVLIWLPIHETHMSKRAGELIEDPNNTLWFSVVSLWEVAIKRALNRPSFTANPQAIRAGLLSSDFHELPVEGRHIPSLSDLPLLHHDPFDRLLLAQAITEGMQLVTADKKLAAYPGPILHV